MDKGPGETRGGSWAAGWWRLVLLVVCVGALVFFGLRYDLGDRLADLRDWVAGFGALAPVAFVLLRAGAAVAMVPGSALSAAAGPLFGPLLGIVCVSAGKTLGAAVAFLISRYVARDAVRARLKRRGHLARFDEFMGRAGGLHVVALARLLPVVPYSAQNYAFGLTALRFWPYVLVSWFFMLPWAVVVVLATDVLARAMAVVGRLDSINVMVARLRAWKIPWTHLTVMLGALMVIIVLAVWEYHRLRVRIEEFQPADGGAPGQPAGADGAGTAS